MNNANHRAADSQLISVVIPVYNEEGNIHVLYRELRRVTQELFFDFEYIFVDDGSSDRTAEIVAQLHTDNPSVKLVQFARNFGHQAAISAGMDYAAGAAVITMDADLQHPPALIPELIRQWKSGFEVVLTQRCESKSEGAFKRLTSAAFYWLMNHCMDRPLLAGGADFRLLDRSVVDQLNGLQERSRFMRGLISWVGYRQTAVEYIAEARHAGVSKYTLRKMLRFATDGLTSFSTFPLRIATYLGLVAAMSGLPYALWAVWARLFTENAAPGWASLIVAILFLGGVQLICLGVLGEYVGRIYEEVKGRPLYIARGTLGLHRPARVDATRAASSSYHPRYMANPADAAEQPVGSYLDDMSA